MIPKYWLDKQINLHFVKIVLLLTLCYFNSTQMKGQSFGDIIQACHDLRDRSSNQNYNNNNYSHSEYSGPTQAQIAAQQAAREKQIREKEAKDLNQTGLDAFVRGDYKTALKYFKNALQKMPDNSSFSYNIRITKEEIAKEEEREKYEEFQRNKNGINERWKGENQNKIGLDKRESSKFGLDKKSNSNFGLDNKDNSHFGLTNSRPILNKLRITDYNDLNPQIAKYMREADNVKVPEFTWDEILQMNIDGLRKNQEKKEYYLYGSKAVIDVFNLFDALSPGQELAVKVALELFIKPTSAGMNEAEILIFKQTAMREKVLSILKDPVKGPQLTSIIKTLREHKPLGIDVNPEQIRFANAVLDPKLGNSSTKIMWSAMLSNEAVSAYVNTAVKAAAGFFSDGLLGKIRMETQNRFASLRDINDKIILGEQYLNTANEFEKPIIEYQIGILEKRMGAFNKVPDVVNTCISDFADYKEIGENKKTE